MSDDVVEVDYLIVGAGAMGMGFADSLLSESESTMAIVDLNDRPGGHWNHAYPFVRLHQPSVSYGVNSRPLGTGMKDEVGLNKGLYELASGQEILSHFDLTMQQTLLPSGRVSYFPMSEVDADGVIISRLSGNQRRVKARRIVDATHSKMAIPSTHERQFTVDPAEVACVPLNDLPRTAPEYSSYVVIGAGKTGMDACIWLLQNGVDPDSIRWVMPRDSWLLNRSNVQLGEDFFARTAKSLADQVEALAKADSVDDLFARLEAEDEVRRVDTSVVPSAYHCAIVSDDELEQLRRIKNIVRLGRVVEIEAHQIVLDHGVVPTDLDCLHIDCSAAGIPTRPSKPVFAGDRITLQWVRVCQPTFSAALIGHVEATRSDDAEKNRLCAPIVPPTVPFDWVKMMDVELANRLLWAQDAEMSEWLAESRLDQFTKLVRTHLGVDEAATEQLGRYVEFVGPASVRAKELLAT